MKSCLKGLHRQLQGFQNLIHIRRYLLILWKLEMITGCLNPLM